MITVEKKDGHGVKISHVIQETTNRQLDIYIFIPGELGLSDKILTEEDFYYNAVQGKRTYYSDIADLPLVHSRLASRGKLSADRYRLSLSLYAYQYALALENTTYQLLRCKQELKREEIEDIANLAIRILKKLRRNVPNDKEIRKYYENIDNYLSWFTEQRCMEIISHLPDGRDYEYLNQFLLGTCSREIEYRKKNGYNSNKVTEDQSRMLNKMRLLRRLIEYPVTMKEKTTELGKLTNKVVTGSAAGIVMIFVTIMLIQARDSLGDITLSFILVLSVIYAAREVFKDDLKRALWRWVRKDKPKWRKQFFDNNTSNLIGHQLEWLEYREFDGLSEDIKQARRYKVSQRAETLLHYKSTTRMSPTKFLSGYDKTRESINIDLGIISNLMGKGSHKIYKFECGKVCGNSVEKRYLINLITKETDEDKTERIYRWKVIMNRTSVVDIEPVIPS